MPHWLVKKKPMGKTCMVWIQISLLEYDAAGDVKPETIKPLIDGGTEGTKPLMLIQTHKITVIYTCVNKCKSH